MSLIQENGDHMVMQVAPMGTAEIEERANALLRDLAPSVLEGAPLDVAELVDHQFQNVGIYFGPINDIHLPNQWALAQIDGDPYDDIEVVVRNTEWHNLFKGGRSAHHARGTFMHELGHAVLHVNQIRRRAVVGLGLPRQYSERELKPYLNAEWQAWCFAGCILAPRSAILAQRIRTPQALAFAFNTSEQLMELHLRRLGMLERTVGPGGPFRSQRGRR